MKGHFFPFDVHILKNLSSSIFKSIRAIFLRCLNPVKFFRCSNVTQSDSSSMFKTFIAVFFIPRSYRVEMGPSIIIPCGNNCLRFSNLAMLIFFDIQQYLQNMFSSTFTICRARFDCCSNLSMSILYNIQVV